VRDHELLPLSIIAEDTRPQHPVVVLSNSIV
jgi:hypothetical protein